MKSLKKISAWILLGIFTIFTSCENNLNETIYGSLADSNFWKTEKDIQEGLYAAYAQMNKRYNGFSIWQFMVEDCGSDISATESTYKDFNTYTGWSSTIPSEVNWGIYKFFWTQISYLNKVIDVIPNAEIDDNKKMVYTSEARALRAFIYFTLVQWFNDIPLVTSSTELNFSIPQQPASKIYEFIETELKESYSNIPTKEQYVATAMTDYSRISRGAALGILARTYWVQKKYEECRDVCKMLIENQDENGMYELMSPYKEMFATNGYKNTEFIWALAGDGINNGLFLQIYLYKPWKNPEPTFKDVYLNWGGDISLTYSFYKSFDNGDKRLAGMYYDSGSNASKVMLTKYPAKTPDKTCSTTDFPIIRYADVLLMYAESLLFADNDIEEAVKWMNKVRERAGVKPLDHTTEDKESLEYKLYNERRWELYFEGCGKRDMMHFGKLLYHIQSKSKDAGTSPERYFYLPFPASALAANPALKQNPGYTK